MNVDFNKERIEKLAKDQALEVGLKKADIVATTTNFTSTINPQLADPKIMHELAHEVVKDVVQNEVAIKDVPTEVSRDLSLKEFKDNVALLKPLLMNKATDLRQLTSLLKDLPTPLVKELSNQNDPDFLFVKTTILQTFANMLKLDIPKDEGDKNRLIQTEQLGVGSSLPIMQEQTNLLNLSNLQEQPNLLKLPNLQKMIAFPVSEIIAIQGIPELIGGMAVLLDKMALKVFDARDGLLNIPQSAEVIASITKNYIALTGTMEKGITAAAALVPNLSTQALANIFLTSSDLEVLTTANKMINQDTLVLAKMQSEIYQTLSPDKLTELVTAYKAARNTIVRQLERVKKALPEYDVKRHSGNFLSDKALNTILTINLMVMEQFPPPTRPTPPLTAAQDAAKTIAKLENFYINGLYTPKEHEELYKNSWVYLEQSIERAKHMDASFIADTITRNILPKNALIELEKRTHDVNLEQAQEKLNSLNADPGSWILFFDEVAEQLEKATIAINRFVHIPIVTTEGLRPILPDFPSGIKH